MRLTLLGFVCFFLVKTQCKVTPNVVDHMLGAAILILCKRNFKSELRASKYQRVVSDQIL